MLKLVFVLTSAAGGTEPYVWSQVDPNLTMQN